MTMWTSWGSYTPPNNSNNICSRCLSIHKNTAFQSSALYFGNWLDTIFPNWRWCAYCQNVLWLLEMKWTHFKNCLTSIKSWTISTVSLSIGFTVNMTNLWSISILFRLWLRSLTICSSNMSSFPKETYPLGNRSS